MPYHAACSVRVGSGPAPRNHRLRPSDPGRSTTGTAPRRERLRHATDALHCDMEARLKAAGCFGSRDGHVLYLRAGAPLFTMLDDAEVGRRLPDWPHRRKAGLIRADLQALGAEEPDAHPAPTTVAAVLPFPWHVGAVFAVLYVLKTRPWGEPCLPAEWRVSDCYGSASRHFLTSTARTAAQCGTATSTPLKAQSLSRARRRSSVLWRPRLSPCSRRRYPRRAPGAFTAYPR